MGITKDTKGIKIVHIMADGSVRDSVEGYLTDVSMLPELTRHMIYTFYKKGLEIMAKKEAEESEQKTGGETVSN